MIILTGNKGFIGKYFTKYFNDYDIIGIDKDDLPVYNKDAKAIVHLGAISDTLEKNWEALSYYNVDSTKKWFDFAFYNNIPFIFASSASIYGNGDGPLNLYAKSKLLSEQYIDNRAVILRFFNVYGPYEDHKGRMASTIFHWFNQIKNTHKAKIFHNSYNLIRDFVYVEDVVKVIKYTIDNYKVGTYDLGSGQNVSFETVLDILLTNMANGEKEYIDFPEDLYKQYQKNTKSNLSPLSSIGYDISQMTSIEKGIISYLEYLRNE